MPPCVLAQSNDPRNVRPQEGDRLVYADGDDKGKPVKAAALTPGTAASAFSTRMTQDAQVMPSIVRSKRSGVGAVGCSVFAGFMI